MFNKLTIITEINHFLIIANFHNCVDNELMKKSLKCRALLSKKRDRALLMCLCNPCHIIRTLEIGKFYILFLSSKTFIFILQPSISFFLHFFTFNTPGAGYTVKICIFNCTFFSNLIPLYTVVGKNISFDLSLNSLQPFRPFDKNSKK